LSPDDLDRVGRSDTGSLFRRELMLRPFRRLGVLIVASLLIAGSPDGEVAEAEARSDRTTGVRKAKGKIAAKATRAKGKQGRKGKRSARRRGRNYFKGHGVASASLRTEPVPKPSGDVWLMVENFREEVRVNIYRPDGSFDEAALAELDRAFRCKRTGEVRAVDPRLYQTLSVISDRFGKKRVDLVSGFRYQRNEGSRHYHASAMDIRIEGVSGRELYEFAESLDPGGMGIGIYPRAGFVHVDWRAPGDNSYRWTDKSPPDGDTPAKRVSARFKPRS
jgi:uncharacterized protein YcbK (DUF882 family)